jgi:hypothetical protein
MLVTAAYRWGLKGLLLLGLRSRSRGLALALSRNLGLSLFGLEPQRRVHACQVKASAAD